MLKNIKNSDTQKSINHSVERYLDKDYFPILYDRPEYCCGCSACFSICPTNAIEMVIDSEGFEYPHIQKSICIRCYECIRVCPAKNV